MLFNKRLKSHHIGKGMMKYVRGKQSIVEALDGAKGENQIIYIHVPYCSNICSFCNMNRSLGKPLENYADLCVDQINLYGKYDGFKNSTIDSIYFGGGTPTVLSSEDIIKILEAIYKNTNLTFDCEISVETSLTDLGVEKLKKIKEAGVNRLSIGIQTFSDRGRKLLGRRGNTEFAINELEKLRETGLENINIDLIYNYFDQTKEELFEDINIINRLDIAGFSFYSLIVMDESRLGKNIDKFNNDDSTKRDLDSYLTIVDNVKNFKFLELTKLVRPNRDNYKYIKRRLEGKNTFPVGAGAGGNIGHLMMMNPIDVGEFNLKCIENFSDNVGMKLSDDYFKIKEAIDDIQLLKYDPKKLHNESINNYFEELVSQNYAYKIEDYYMLNKFGAFWGNNITAKLWELIEGKQ